MRLHDLLIYYKKQNIINIVEVIFFSEVAIILVFVVLTHIFMYLYYICISLTIYIIYMF